MLLTFKARTRKVGNSVVVTIPSDFIKAGMVKEKETYHVSVMVEKEAQK